MSQANQFTTDNAARNATILAALAEGLSFTQVARRLGLERGVVAGVSWRAKKAQPPSQAVH